MGKARFMIMVENYEKNKEEIEKGPYIRQMDLAISCSQLIMMDTKEMFTCHVTWDLLRLWDMSPETLFKMAGEHSRKYLPPTVEPMSDVIKGCLVEHFLEDAKINLEIAMKKAEKEYLKIFGVPEEKIPEIYVVSNGVRIHGASVIFYADILKEFANKKECDLILLPSSIHEWLVIQETQACELKELKSMVYDANRLVVREEEVLSDNVYRYSRKSDKIEILNSDFD